MLPRAVVFDVGHVLLDWDVRHLFRKLIADEDALERFVREIVSFAWHEQHDAGRPFAETSAELIARHPDHAALIAAYGPRFAETIPGPIAGMPAIVAALAEKGVPLFAITNFGHEFWPPVRAAHAALFAPFRDIVVSGTERLVKPDPAIFALARTRFGLGAGEALFVDDRADNVAAAERQGFAGHVFAGADRLRDTLESLALLP